MRCDRVRWSGEDRQRSVLRQGKCYVYVSYKPNEIRRVTRTSRSDNGIK